MELFIAPPLKIRFAVPVERVETTIFNPRVESRCFNPLHSYSQSDSQKSCYTKYFARFLFDFQTESIQRVIQSINVLIF